MKDKKDAEYIVSCPRCDLNDRIVIKSFTSMPLYDEDCPPEDWLFCERCNLIIEEL